MALINEIRQITPEQLDERISICVNEEKGHQYLVDKLNTFFDSNEQDPLSTEQIDLLRRRYLNALLTSKIETILQKAQCITEYDEMNLLYITDISSSMDLKNVLNKFLNNEEYRHFVNDFDKCDEAEQDGIVQNFVKDSLDQLISKAKLKDKYITELEPQVHFLEAFRNIIFGDYNSNFIDVLIQIKKCIEHKNFDSTELNNFLQNPSLYSTYNDVKDLMEKAKKLNFNILNEYAIISELLNLGTLNLQERRENNKQILIIRGISYSMSDVYTKTELLQKLRNNSFEIQEVHFLAAKTILLDQDLDHSKWAGTNLSIMAEELHIDQVRTIDLSGKEPKFLLEEAFDSKNENEPGCDGKMGRHGHNSGNLKIIAEIKNPERLVVKLNGGQGYRGEKGGNGYNGKQGFGIEDYYYGQSECPNGMEGYERWIKCLKGHFGVTRTFRIGHFENFKDRFEKIFNENLIVIKSNHRYFYGRTSLGITIKLSVSSSRFSIINVFLLCKGSDGTCGSSGGHGGLGGIGGKQGICVAKRKLEDDAEYDQLKIINLPGKKGMKGENGMQGAYGKHGSDVGLIAFEDGRLYEYGGNGKKIKENYYENREPESCYIEFEKKYAKLTDEKNIEDTHLRKVEINEDLYEENTTNETTDKSQYTFSSIFTQNYPMIFTNLTKALSDGISSKKKRSRFYGILSNNTFQIHQKVTTYKEALVEEKEVVVSNNTLSIKDISGEIKEIFERLIEDLMTFMQNKNNLEYITDENRRKNLSIFLDTTNTNITFFTIQNNEPVDCSEILSADSCIFKTFHINTRDALKKLAPPFQNNDKMLRFIILLCICNRIKLNDENALFLVNTVLEYDDKDNFADILFEQFKNMDKHFIRTLATLKLENCYKEDFSEYITNTDEEILILFCFRISVEEFNDFNIANMRELLVAMNELSIPYELLKLNKLELKQWHSILKHNNEIKLDYGSLRIPTIIKDSVFKLVGIKTNKQQNPIYEHLKEHLKKIEKEALNKKIKIDEDKESRSFFALLTGEVHPDDVDEFLNGSNNQKFFKKPRNYDKMIEIMKIKNEQIKEDIEKNLIDIIKYDELEKQNSILFEAIKQKKRDKKLSEANQKQLEDENLTKYLLFADKDDIMKNFHSDRSLYMDELKKFKCALNDSAYDKQFLLIYLLMNIIEEILNKIFKENAFNINVVQRFAVLSSFIEGKQMLAQIPTGEGKSLIIIIIAIIKAMSGKIVHVVTTSSVLARRDATISAEENLTVHEIHKIARSRRSYAVLYQEFNINSGHICTENIKERTRAYKRCQVIYGDLASFQRDYLLKEYFNYDFDNMNILNLHVLVDEVDSMLLDHANHVLNLSHEVPSFSRLQEALVFIWILVNRQKIKAGGRINLSCIDNIYQEVCPDPNKIFKLNEIKNLFPNEKLIKPNVLESFYARFIYEAHDVSSILDADQLHKLAKKRLDKRQFEEKEMQFEERILNRLKVYFEFKTEDLIHKNIFPHFIDTKVFARSLIKGAIMAINLKENIDYVVDFSRENGGLFPGIIIIDQDTGTDQSNARWGDAVHQFLQLKHGCELKTMSFKGVLISNVTFFKMYENLRGFTGTLGGKLEEELLKKLYSNDLKLIKFPTSKLKNFYEREAKIFNNPNSWKECIYEVVITMFHNSRSVLIICETIETVDLLCNFLKKKAEHMRKDDSLEKDSWKIEESDNLFKGIYTYKRDYEKFPFDHNQQLDIKKLVIATNLAGRGTDIKITSTLKDKGGLHVILTFLAKNIRIEEQAYGRAARYGESGSAETILINPYRTTENIINIRRIRQIEETSRINEMQAHYRQVVIKDEQYSENMKDFYKNLVVTKYDANKKLISAEVKNIELQKIMDNFTSDKYLCELKLIKEIMKTGYRNDEGAIVIDWKNKLTCTTPTSILDTVIINIKAKNYEKANETINLLTEYSFYEAETLYYKSYIDIKVMEKKLKPEEKSKYDMIRLQLKRAQFLLEKRVLISLKNKQWISNFRTQDYKRQNLPFSGFTEQQNKLINYYQFLISKIEQLIGRYMDPEIFINNEITFSMGESLITKLRNGEIIEKYSVVDLEDWRNIWKDIDLRKIAYQYRVPFTCFEKMLEKFRSGLSVTPELISKEILSDSSCNYKCLMPSRETLWKILKDKKYIETTEEVFRWNKSRFEKEVKDERRDLRDILTSDSSEFQINPSRKRHFIQLMDDDFYDEYIDIKASEIEKKISLNNIATLCSTKILVKKECGYFNEIKFEQEIDFTEQSLCNKYMIRSEIFSKNEFYKLLEINEFDGDEFVVDEFDVYMKLLKMNGLIKELEDGRYILGEFSKSKLSLLFRRDIEIALETAFPYGIAFQKLYNLLKNNQNNDDCELSLALLPYEPHRLLFYDLIRYGIVDVGRVNRKKLSISSIKKIIQSCDGNNWERICKNKSKINECAETVLKKIVECAAIINFDDVKSKFTLIEITEMKEEMLKNKFLPYADICIKDSIRHLISIKIPKDQKRWYNIMGYSQILIGAPFIMAPELDELLDGVDLPFIKTVYKIMSKSMENIDTYLLNQGVSDLNTLSQGRQQGWIQSYTDFRKEDFKNLLFIRLISFFITKPELNINKGEEVKSTDKKESNSQLKKAKNIAYQLSFIFKQREEENKFEIEVKNEDVSFANRSNNPTLCNYYKLLAKNYLKTNKTVWLVVAIKENAFIDKDLYFEVLTIWKLMVDDLYKKYYNEFKPIQKHNYTPDEYKDFIKSTLSWYGLYINNYNKLILFPEDHFSELSYHNDTILHKIYRWFADMKISPIPNELRNFDEARLSIIRAVENEKERENIINNPLYEEFLHYFQK